jgi:hypothetical protein
VAAVVVAHLVQQDRLHTPRRLSQDMAVVVRRRKHSRLVEDTHSVATVESAGMQLQSSTVEADTHSCTSTEVRSLLARVVYSSWMWMVELGPGVSTVGNRCTRCNSTAAAAAAAVDKRRQWKTGDKRRQRKGNSMRTMKVDRQMDTPMMEAVAAAIVADTIHTATAGRLPRNLMREQVQRMVQEVARRLHTLHIPLVLGLKVEHT